MSNTHGSDLDQVFTIERLSDSFRTAILSGCKEHRPDSTLFGLDADAWEPGLMHLARELANAVEPLVVDGVSTTSAAQAGTLVIEFRVDSLEEAKDEISLVGNAMISGSALSPSCEGQVDVSTEASLEKCEPLSTKDGVLTEPHGSGSGDASLHDQRYKVRRHIQFDPLGHLQPCVKAAEHDRKRGDWTAPIRAACYSCILEALSDRKDFPKPRRDDKQDGPQGTSNAPDPISWKLQFPSVGYKGSHESQQTAIITRWMASASRKSVIDDVVQLFKRHLFNSAHSLPNSFDIIARPLENWKDEEGRGIMSRRCKVLASKDGKVLTSRDEPFEREFTLAINTAELPGLREPMKKPSRREYDDRRRARAQGSE